MTLFERIIRASWPPVLVFIFLALGIFFGERHQASQAFDQDYYHMQVIRQFESEWPKPNISDFTSATGPTYHLVMVVIGKVVGSDLATLRLASMIFGIGLITAVASVSALFIGVRGAALLAMPLATSMYVVASGIYVHTDNFAWMCAAVVVGIAAFGRVSVVNLFAAACFAALAVSIRQSFIWTIGPLIFAGLLASPLGSRLCRRQTDEEILEGRWGALAGTLLASIPALVVLGVLISLWGGLIQEKYRLYHSTEYSLCVFGYGAAVFGLYAPFFLIALPNLRELFQRFLSWIITGAIVGGLAALVAATTPDADAGRTGGPVWLLAGIGPTIADRSVVLTLMAAFGGGALALFIGAGFAQGRGYGSLVTFCALIAIFCTQLVNDQVFQRYFDTPILMVLIWLTALGIGEQSDAQDRVAIGPPLLAVILAFLLTVRAVGL